jgi:hypothetical protein
VSRRSATEYVRVRLTTDVGTIFAVDGEEYDLAAGDVVDLPVLNARPLLDHSAAVRVDATGERPASAAEAEAVAGHEVAERRPEPTISFDFAEWLWHQQTDETDDTDGDVSLMAAAMGDPDASSTLQTSATQTDATTSPGSGSSMAFPTAALPLAQLDALNPQERRRLARRRGLDWPSTADAREQLFETIATVMREEDHRVVDAPTSLGKTHTIAATRWGAREELTGGNPVVHLLQTRDARDEAVDVAREEGGRHFVLRARHEACPVAAGDHDPDPETDGDDDRQTITINGEPASEWLGTMCDGRGVPFSAAHRHLEAHNDQGVDLPCTADSEDHVDESDGTGGECPAIRQWDELRDGDYPLVIATHNFAHVPGLRAGTNLVFDEEPDFTQDLSTSRVREAVGAYLREIDAPVRTWEAFIQLAQYEGYGDDASNEREALQHALDAEPEREWYFTEPEAHTLAPALARAIFHAEERANGRRVGKTPYEPPRLDARAHDDDGWNRTWLTVVLDESNDVQTVRSVPDLSPGLTRSVIGLDAHPALPVWQANTYPGIQRARVLDPEARQLWRRYERGLRVVQVGDATRPLASGEYFDWNGTRAVVEHLRDTYGEDFRTAITAKSVEDELESLLDRAGVHDPGTMHYGEEKSRNDFAAERVGLVNGSIDPGDDYVLDLLAELDLDATPERSDRCCAHCGDREHAPEEPGDGCEECHGTGWGRKHGRGFVGDDAEAARAILASVRENHTAQAAGRYARNPDDPTSTATVFVRTDAIPPGFADVQTPGVVWTYGNKQDRVVEALREADRPLSARELANRAECTKEHVRQTLRRFEDMDGADTIHAFENAGEYGATLYAEAGVPNAGVVDLGDGIANSPVWDLYTWGLAIRDPLLAESGSTSDSAGEQDNESRVWAWEDATVAGDNGGGPPDGSV